MYTCERHEENGTFKSAQKEDLSCRPDIEFAEVHRSVSGELLDGCLCHGIWHKACDSYSRIHRGHIDDRPSSAPITQQGYKMPGHQRSTFYVDCVRFVERCIREKRLIPSNKETIPIALTQ